MAHVDLRDQIEIKRACKSMYLIGIFVMWDVAPMPWLIRSSGMCGNYQGLQSYHIMTLGCRRILAATGSLKRLVREEWPNS